MKAIMFVVTIVTTMGLFAQNKVNINGKVDISSGSKNIFIGNFSAPVNSDGSFSLAIEVEKPSSELIRTDSSGASGIWIEPGDYTIECNEQRRDYGTRSNYILLVKNVSGPENARLFSYHQQQTWSGFKVYTDRIKGKLPDEELQKAGAMLFMDSLLAVNTTSPALPQIIRWTHRFVGDSVTARYIQMLSPALQKNDELQIVQKDINRNKKLKVEKIFENFTLTDMNGHLFTLSDLKDKKAILLDFWASDCGPCRIVHPTLKKLHEKYKDKGLEIVGISIDYNKNKWVEAIKKDGIESFVNVADLKGWDADLMNSYFIPFIPFKFLLNGKREIVGVYPGYSPSEKEITALLEKE